MATDNRTASQFDDTPEGWAQRWHFELKKAKEGLAEFYQVAKAADEAARDEMRDNGGKRLCLYASSNQVLAAMLYGRTPQASVSRKFADANDDVARVAAEMMERVLNCDIQRTDDTFAEATQNARMDWVNVSLGVQRHRYERGEAEMTEEVPAKLDEETGEEMAPGIPPQETYPSERVETDYVHYTDFLWGQCRVWSEVPWVAFRVKMAKEALVKRFGKDLAAQIPLNAKHATPDDSKDDEKTHPWDRAEVWEIWHRDSKQVFWVVEGFRQTLDIKPDPLELEGFYPCQKPMMDLPTTSKMVPVPRFKFIQDLENSINTLTTRIDKLVKAAAVKGGYAKELGPIIKRLVDGGENELIPVEEWALVGEKGGLQGAIVYLPLEQIMAAIQTLDGQRQRDMDLMYQVTGQSDLMRGQQTVNGTPGEAKVKAKSASIRIQSMQDEIARFASEGQRIRAEIIAKHCSPETIIKHSNIEQTPDAQFAQDAVALIQSRFADYRIEIKPEAINLTDFAALKEERTEVMAAVGAFFQQAQPIMQLGPLGMKFALEMLQVSLAGLKGASAYEGIIDQAIAQVEQVQAQAAANPQPQQPDPKMQAEQVKLQGVAMKGQLDMQREQFKLQADMARTQAEVQADGQREEKQRIENVRETAEKQIVTNALKPQPMPTGGMP